MTFYHPKYYAELRRLRKLQAASDKHLKLQASSLKHQAKIDTSHKHQATSNKRLET